MFLKVVSRAMAPSTTECPAILSARVTYFEYRLRDICNACDYYNELGMFQVSYLMLANRKFDHIVQVYRIFQTIAVGWNPL